MTTKILEYVLSVQPAVQIAEPAIIPPPAGKRWSIDDLYALDGGDVIPGFSLPLARLFRKRP